MAKSPEFELQELLYSTLSSDQTVSSLVHGVYDRVPPSPWGDEDGYISFGPSTFTPDDADCVVSGEHSVQIDVWSRRVGQKHCKMVCSAIRNCLHDADLSLSVNALVDIRLVLQRIMTDPDGVTTHAAMQFLVMIEEPKDG